MSMARASARVRFLPGAAWKDSLERTACARGFSGVFLYSHTHEATIRFATTRLPRGSVVQSNRNEKG